MIQLFSAAAASVEIKSPVEHSLVPRGFCFGALDLEAFVATAGRFNEQQFRRRADRFERNVRFAAAKSLTQVADLTRGAVRLEMSSRFDRPTPFTLNSGYIKPATKDKLESKYGIKDRLQSKVDRGPAELLGHEFRGGSRRYKRMEGAFRRIGMLGNDEVAVPGQGAKLDAYGNLSRGFIVQLLSYFNAFGEQGYRANATDKSRKRTAKRGKSERGFVTINGVRYFYARGLKGAGKAGHLAKGIYAARGIHGVDLVPVLMFVRKPRYERRIEIPRLAREVFRERFRGLFVDNLRSALAR